MASPLSAYTCGHTAHSLAARMNDSGLALSDRLAAVQSLQRLAAEHPESADLIYFLVLRLNEASTTQEFMEAFRHAKNEIKHFVDE